MYRIAIALLALGVCAVAVPYTKVVNPKVSLSLQRSLTAKPFVDILVSMQTGKPRLVLESLEAQPSKFANRGEKATAVFNALSENAASSQRNVLTMLKSSTFTPFGSKFETLWITNQIYVQGADASLILALAAMDDVSQILEDGIVELDAPVYISNSSEGREPGVLAEWGVQKIGAEAAWILGYRGQRVVIGITDTGARHTHQILASNFRGGEFSWYNPYSPTQASPSDGHGHGTHVTGTIAGLNGFGVAPRAKWISCKGLQDSGSGTWANLIKCGQFMACPHNIDMTEVDCSLAPDAVSNSWGVGSGSTEYDDVIRAWHAVGIVPVKSLGNSGPSCRTPTSPGDSRVGILGIGASTTTDSIENYSSRGPSVWGEQKPQVVAPGSNVRSASHFSDTSYTTMSGTSMACPHVSGLVALMRSKNPNASYERIKEALQISAVRDLVFTGESCEGVSDRQFPNFKSGYGRVDAYEAVKFI